MSGEPFLGVKVHAWDVLDEGYVTVCENLKALGFDVAFVVVSWFEERHPPQGLLPHNPEREVFLSSGHPYFRTRLPYFEERPDIIPLVRKWDVKACAWVSALCNEVLASKGFHASLKGSKSKFWLCPTKSKEVLGRLLSSLRKYGFPIVLDRLRYSSKGPCSCGKCSEETIPSLLEALSPDFFTVLPPSIAESVGQDPSWASSPNAIVLFDESVKRILGPERFAEALWKTVEEKPPAVCLSLWDMPTKLILKLARKLAQKGVSIVADCYGWSKFSKLYALSKGFRKLH